MHSESFIPVTKDVLSSEKTAGRWRDHIWEMMKSPLSICLNSKQAIASHLQSASPQKLQNTCLVVAFSHPFSPERMHTCCIHLLCTTNDACHGTIFYGWHRFYLQSKACEKPCVEERQACTHSMWRNTNTWHLSGSSKLDLALNQWKYQLCVPANQYTGTGHPLEIMSSRCTAAYQIEWQPKTSQKGCGSWGPQTMDYGDRKQLSRSCHCTSTSQPQKSCRYSWPYCYKSSTSSLLPTQLQGWGHHVHNCQGGAHMAEFGHRSLSLLSVS